MDITFFTSTEFFLAMLFIGFFILTELRIPQWLRITANVAITVAVVGIIYNVL